MDQNYEEWGQYEEKSQYCIALYLQANPLKISPPASPTLEEKKEKENCSYRDWCFRNWCSAMSIQMGFKVTGEPHLS